MRECRERIEIIQADITQLDVDAIVNAANSQLAGGGGVDGAIHAAGGPDILEECQKIIGEIGECSAGEAVITTGGNLKAKYVIHTVGPIWKNGQEDEAEKLKRCYLNSLLLAQKHQLKSIAFSNISTGVYGYPKAQAAKIAFNTVLNNLVDLEYPRKVIFVCYDQENYELYLKLEENLING